MKVTEFFFGPQIDAAFAGITVRQLDDGNSLRPEKQKDGNDPEPNRDAAVRGDRGDNVQVENGHDK